MDDLIKLTAALVAVAAVIVLFVYGAVFLGIPIVIGYLLWRFWLRDYWHSKKQAKWERRETRETKELYERAQKAFRASDLAREDAREELVDMIAFAALDQLDREPVGAVRPHSALSYRPPAPQTIVPKRTDPACAMDGLQPDQPFPITVPGLT